MGVYENAYVLFYGLRRHRNAALVAASWDVWRRRRSDHNDMEEEQLIDQLTND